MTNNSELCDSLTLTSEVEQQFNQGKISKGDFESKILGWRALRLLSENEQTTYILENAAGSKEEERQNYQAKMTSLNEKITRLRKANAKEKGPSR